MEFDNSDSSSGDLWHEAKREEEEISLNTSSPRNPESVRLNLSGDDSSPSPSTTKSPTKISFQTDDGKSTTQNLEEFDRLIHKYKLEETKTDLDNLYYDYDKDTNPYDSIDSANKTQTQDSIDSFKISPTLPSLHQRSFDNPPSKDTKNLEQGVSAFRHVVFKKKETEKETEKINSFPTEDKPPKTSPMKEKFGFKKPSDNKKKAPRKDGDEIDEDKFENEVIKFSAPTKSNGWRFKTGEESEEEEDLPGHVISEDPHCEIPHFISKKLRDYQIQGVTFLYNLWSKNLGGILADDMGLGKTIQTVAFVTTLIRHFAKETKNPKDNKKFLIIAPITTLEHWRREFKKWGKNSKVKLYHGTKRSQAFSELENGRIQVLLTSYETFQLELERMNSIDWCAIVLDEVHRIKNNKSKISIACNNMLCHRRFGLTGTMMQNDLEELWTLLNWAQPGSFGSLQYFRDAFMMPIKRCNRFDASGTELAKGRKAAKNLRERLSKIALRRDKSIISHLLPKKDDYIIFCPLTKLQKSVYEHVLQLPDYVLLRESQEMCTCGNSVNKTKRQCCMAPQFENLDKLLFPCLMNLTKVANHLYLLTPDSRGNKKKPEKELEARKFMKQALMNDDEKVKSVTKMHSENNTELSGKLKVLAQLLVKWKEVGNKVLLFASKTRMLDILEKFVRSLKFNYCRLDGSIASEKRQSVCDTFNKNANKFVFLISTKVGGLGLNLVSANIVVIFDPDWNASNDLQAQDRAYRLGQTRDTEIYRLITAGTIEESIYQRQLYKQQLANTTVAGNHEKRYFKGVQGVKGQEGELFGMKNLLKLETNSILTDDIIQRTEKQYEIVKNKLQNEEQLGGIMDVIFGEKELNDEEFIKNVRKNEEEKEEKTSSALSEKMKEVGVLYFHKNTDVVGDFALEQKLTERVTENLEKQEIQKTSLLRACAGLDPLDSLLPLHENDFQRGRGFHRGTHEQGEEIVDEIRSFRDPNKKKKRGSRNKDNKSPSKRKEGTSGRENGEDVVLQMGRNKVSKIRLFSEGNGGAGNGLFGNRTLPLGNGKTVIKGFENKSGPLQEMSRRLVPNENRPKQQNKEPSNGLSKKRKVIAPMATESRPLKLVPVHAGQKDVAPKQIASKRPKTGAPAIVPPASNSSTRVIDLTDD